MFLFLYYKPKVKVIEYFQQRSQKEYIDFFPLNFPPSFRNFQLLFKWFNFCKSYLWSKFHYRFLDLLLLWMSHKIIVHIIFVQDSVNYLCWDFSKSERDLFPENPLLPLSTFNIYLPMYLNWSSKHHISKLSPTVIILPFAKWVWLNFLVMLFSIMSPHFDQWKIFLERWDSCWSKAVPIWFTIAPSATVWTGSSHEDWS